MDRHGNFRIHKIKLWMQRQNLSLKNRELYKCATTGQDVAIDIFSQSFLNCSMERNIYIYIYIKITYLQQIYRTHARELDTSPSAFGPIIRY